MNTRFLRRTIAALALAVSVTPAAQAQRAPISVRWLGHAAFEVVSSGGTRILIDPFLSGNPTTPDSLKNMARYAGSETDLGTRDSSIKSDSYRGLVGLKYSIGALDGDSAVGWSRNEVTNGATNRLSLTGVSAAFGVPSTRL